MREWGQLLAYLPQVKKLCLEGGGRALLLPTPVLSRDSIHNPQDTIGIEASSRGISASQARAEARAEISGWLHMVGEPADRIDRVLGH